MSPAQAAVVTVAISIPLEVVGIVATIRVLAWWDRRTAPRPVAHVPLDVDLDAARSSVVQERSR